ncbi:olee1-like protein [Prunus avium]|uniref:Olee1-like protein n=1 Tax=Prunus avium TaxID=42229 RepID=A0A6P5RR23_PRUAV|nr:olee1-like protein [Prunus avium]
MSTKSSTTILGFAFCFLSLLSFAYSNTTDDKIYLSGLVYCDNCQLKSMTEISKMIPGAKVRLECREGGDIKSSQEGETNQLGLYVFELDKSEEPVDDCQVTVLQSPDPECKISHEVDPNNKSKTAPVATRKLNLLEGDSVVFIGPSHRVSYPLGLVVDNARPECEQFAKARKHFQN